MADEQKFKLTNIYGGDVEVTATAVGELIATLQCLPQALEGEDEEPQHTLEVLARRLEALGIPVDRRTTAEYRTEMDGDEAAPAP